jgi:hypothetical protein
MIENSTKNLLVKFLYHEASASESVEVLECIHNDPVQGAEFREMKNALALLPKVLFTPSDNVINSILSHGRRTAFESSL